jgi:mannan endo-1,4-beta-mannosidase
MFEFVAESSKSNGVVAGANFWAFGGTARPIKSQIFWKKGNDYMGDPPMEEQGLNTVFDSDKTTWAVINKYYKLLSTK